MQFPINYPEMPAAHYADESAVYAHAHHAAAYEVAIRDFERDGDEAARSHALQGLAFDAAEIAWHLARPGERMPQGYALRLTTT